MREFRVPVSQGKVGRVMLVECDLVNLSRSMDFGRDILYYYLRKQWTI